MVFCLFWLLCVLEQVLRLIKHNTCSRHGRIVAIKIYVHIFWDHVLLKISACRVLKVPGIRDKTKCKRCVNYRVFVVQRSCISRLRWLPFNLGVIMGGSLQFFKHQRPLNGYPATDGCSTPVWFIKKSNIYFWIICFYLFLHWKLSENTVCAEKEPNPNTTWSIVFYILIVESFLDYLKSS